MLNEYQIQRAFCFDRYRRSTICPNYTPPDWWECDVFELTEAGFFREYEIKLTTADFRADKEKSRKRWRGVWPNQVEETLIKHELLAAGDTRGPSQFFYVAPANVIPEAELPPWAGLIRVELMPNRTWVQMETIKPAPRIHSEKADPKVAQHLDSVFYYRFHTLFLRLKNSAVVNPEAAFA